MKTYRLSRVPALVSVLLVLGVTLAACGRNAPAATSGQPSIPSAGETLYVIDGSPVNGAPAWESTSAGSQRIVAFHPGSASPSLLLSLPMGITTQDHQRLYATTVSGGQTTVTIYDTRTGARLGSFSFPGAYAADGRGYAGAVISPDGRWLVLRQSGAAASSRFALVDTQARRLVRALDLPGTFDLDALSPNGAMLYLLQNLNDAERHYYVRAYDLTAYRLLDAIIVDKTQLDETQMAGAALTRQMASDGSIAYTLYIDPAHNHAFIHVLPLVSGPDSAFFAHCIDLPSSTAPDLLRFYTLTLSPDGTALYAANAALGLVSAISLHGQDIYSDLVTRTGHFTPTNAGTSADGALPALYAGAAISGDQQHLYVVGPRGIAAIRTSDLRLERVYASQEAFTSVAMSANGQVLYAADPAQGMLLIPLTGASAARQLQSPAQSPWGIAWVRAS